MFASDYFDKIYQGGGAAMSLSFFGTNIKAPKNVTG